MHIFPRSRRNPKGEGAPDLVAARQNYYCEKPATESHTPRTMKSLGLPEKDVDLFCTDMLFPQIDINML